MNVIFFGSSDYCLPIVQTLQHHHALTAIVTRPDKPVGRSQQLEPSPIKRFGIEHTISVHTPASKDELIAIKPTLESYHADVAIVADYGLIIPREIFEIPTHDTLNIHFSKLPKLRGASPVQFTILLGEKTAWITLMKMDVSLDTGDILWQQEYAINNPMTTKELYTKLFTDIGSELFPLVTDYVQGTVTPVTQDDNAATFTRRLTREDGYIPYEVLSAACHGETTLTVPKDSLLEVAMHALRETEKIAHAVDRFVRALSPWPGVWTTITINNESKRLKILSIREVINGKLILDEVQLEGKNKVPWNQFIQAYPNFLH